MFCRSRILKLTERIIKKIDNLGYATPGDACEIVEMIDKLEDYLMDYKAYSKKFKEDVRYLRYLTWLIIAAEADIQHYYQKDAMKHASALKDELELWTLKKVEVKDED